MNTHIFIGWEAPPLEAIPEGCWAEREAHPVCKGKNLCTLGCIFYPCSRRWFMVYPP